MLSIVNIQPSHLRRCTSNICYSSKKCIRNSTKIRRINRNQTRSSKNRATRTHRSINLNTPRTLGRISIRSKRIIRVEYQLILSRSCKVSICVCKAFCHCLIRITRNKVKLYLMVILTLTCLFFRYYILVIPCSRSDAYRKIPVRCICISGTHRQACIGSGIRVHVVVISPNLVVRVSNPTTVRCLIYNHYCKSNKVAYRQACEMQTIRNLIGLRIYAYP